MRRLNRKHYKEVSIVESIEKLSAIIESESHTAMFQKVVEIKKELKALNNLPVYRAMKRRNKYAFK